MNDNSGKPADRHPALDDVRISAYLDGQLTPSERAALEVLLSSDVTYRTAVDQLRQVSESVQSLPRLTLDDGFAGRVMEQAQAAAHSHGEQAADTVDSTERGGRPSGAASSSVERASSLGRKWGNYVFAAIAVAAATLFILLSPSLNPLGQGISEVAQQSSNTSSQPEGTSNSSRSLVELEEASDFGDADRADSDSNAENESLGKQLGADARVKKFALEQETDIVGKGHASNRKHGGIAPSELQLQDEYNEAVENETSRTDDLAVKDWENLSRDSSRLHDLPAASVPAVENVAGSRMATRGDARLASPPSAPDVALEAAPLMDESIVRFRTTGTEGRAELDAVAATEAASHLRFLNGTYKKANDGQRLDRWEREQQFTASLRPAVTQRGQSAALEQIAVVSLPAKTDWTGFVRSAEATGIRMEAETAVGLRQSGWDSGLGDAGGMQPLDEGFVGGGASDSAKKKERSAAVDDYFDDQGRGAKFGSERIVEDDPNTLLDGISDKKSDDAEVNRVSESAETPVRGYAYVIRDSLDSDGDASKQPIGRVEKRYFGSTNEGDESEDDEKAKAEGVAAMKAVADGAGEPGANTRVEEGDDIAAFSATTESAIMRESASSQSVEESMSESKTVTGGGLGGAAGRSELRGRYVLVEAAPEVMETFIASLGGASSGNLAARSKTMWFGRKANEDFYAIQEILRKAAESVDVADPVATPESATAVGTALSVTAGKAKRIDSSSLSPVDQANQVEQKFMAPLAPLAPLAPAAPAITSGLETTAQPLSDAAAKARRSGDRQNKLWGAPLNGILPSDAQDTPDPPATAPTTVRVLFFLPQE